MRLAGREIGCAIAVARPKVCFSQSLDLTLRELDIRAVFWGRITQDLLHKDSFLLLRE
jgi:hypothetical protein